MNTVDNINDVIQLLEICILITPDKIIFDPEAFKNYLSADRFKYPSYSVISKYDTDLKKQVMDYIFYIDKNTTLKSTVQLDPESVFDLFKKLDTDFKSGSISDENKNNILKQSFLVAVSDVPNYFEVMSSYVVWMYSYIGFFTMFNVLNIDQGLSYVFTDTNDVDFIFPKEFLNYMSTKLQKLNLPESYNRWIKMATPINY